MRRRTFVASGLGLLETAASQGLVWTFDNGLRAQPATTPGTRSNATGSPQGKWIRLAPFPQATGELLGVAINGKIFVIVGAGQAPDASIPSVRPQQPQQSLGTVEEYDPATNTWRARAPMPTPYNHMGGEAANGKIYVIGGRLSRAFIIGFPGNA